MVAPWTYATAPDSRLPLGTGPVFTDPQFFETFVPVLWRLPLFPRYLSHSATQPLVQLSHMLLGIRQCIVVDPASYRPPQTVSNFLPRPPLVAAGLAASPSASCDSGSWLQMRMPTPPCSSVEAETQKCPLCCQVYCALAFVHLQTQFPFHVSPGTHQALVSAAR